MWKRKTPRHVHSHFVFPQILKSLSYHVFGRSEVIELRGKEEQDDTNLILAVISFPPLPPLKSLSTFASHFTSLATEPF